MKELRCSLPNPIVWSDNIEAIALAYNLMFQLRTNHIEIDIHFASDKVLSKEMEIQYVPI